MRTTVVVVFCLAAASLVTLSLAKCYKDISALLCFSIIGITCCFFMNLANIGGFWGGIVLI